MNFTPGPWRVVSEPYWHVRSASNECVFASDYAPSANADVIAGAPKFVEALKAIQRRATPHPDDTDADRKRDLYHCEQLARFALAHAGIAL